MNNDVGIDFLTFDKAAEIASFQGVEPQGYEILVRLYIPPTVQNNIILPDSSHDDLKYSSCVGLVIDKAPGVYKDERYKDTGKWCEIGDWIIFPRHSGLQFICDNKPCYFIKEDALYSKIDDPRRITR